MPLRIEGDVRVPGDKSITHRVLMFAAAAAGESRLRGVLASEDPCSTAEVLRALGAQIEPLSAEREVRVRSDGLRAWRAPAEVLDCGNSGTTARLMMGWLAASHVRATLSGDASLRSRPMRRVTEPLALMGASCRESGAPGCLPITVAGGPLASIAYDSPVASAQVKSAILLAGAAAGVDVSVREPIRSRDHTERLLTALGADVRERADDGAHRVNLAGGVDFRPLDLEVPGDPSSAAFLAALAWLSDAGELRIGRVCANPTRTGFFTVARRMGAQFDWAGAANNGGGEDVADLIARPSRLCGTTVRAEEIPAAIDEIPILAVLAARATGETRIEGAGELRVKESDRIRALVQNLRAIGVEAEELADGLVVIGTDAPLAGHIRTYGDHRIAMAFGVLGALPGNRIDVDQPGVADVSFPGFWPLLRQLTHG